MARAAGSGRGIALEATLYWAWLHDRLTAAGYQVTVAHAQQVKLICAARCKTDPVDAAKLAELLRMDLLPAIWIPDAATRAQRKLLRGRPWLVRRRTQVKNRVHAYLAEENQRIEVTDLFGQAGLEWLATVALPQPVPTSMTTRSGDHPAKHRRNAAAVVRSRPFSSTVPPTSSRQDSL